MKIKLVFLVLALVVCCSGFQRPTAKAAYPKGSRAVRSDDPPCEQPCYLYTDPETGEITIICPCP